MIEIDIVERAVTGCQLADFPSARQIRILRGIVRHKDPEGEASAIGLSGGFMIDVNFQIPYFHLIEAGILRGNGEGEERIGEYFPIVGKRGRDQGGKHQNCQ